MNTNKTYYLPSNKNAAPLDFTVLRRGDGEMVYLGYSGPSTSQFSFSTTSLTMIQPVIIPTCQAKISKLYFGPSSIIFLFSREFIT